MSSRDVGGLITRSPALVTFGVMVIAIVGGGVLALPTALAPFGARRAMVIIVAMGLINLMSLLALSSAISRSTAPASGRGRLSTLTSEHLGSTTALVATIASITLWFGLLVVYVLGLATTLRDLGGDALTWTITVLAVIGFLVYFQARKLFVAWATAIAALNVVILSIMIIGVVFQARADLFTAGPPPTGPGGSGDTLQLVFGTVLFAFFGHTALFSVAPEVARVDPTGRSLRRGATAAMVTAIFINVGWVVACLSAIPADQFMNEASTGIDLIVEVAGTWMRPLSVVFVVLAMGGAGLNAAFAVGDVIAERLPGLRRISTVLRPGSSIEIFEPLLSVGVTIAAVNHGDSTALIARGRRGRQHHREEIDGPTWDGSTMLRTLGVKRRRAVLHVSIDGTADDGLIVSVESTLPLIQRWPAAGRGSALLGTVSDGEPGDLEQLSALIMQSVARQPAPTHEVLSAVASRAGASAERTLEVFTILETQRRVQLRDDGLVHAVLGQRSKARSAAVEALLTGIEDSPIGRPEVDVAPRAVALAHGTWRRAIQASPALGALIMVTVLLSSGASFAEAIDLVAMATILLLAGVVPLLLGISLRRRAERPVSTLRIADSPLLQVALLFGFAAVSIVYATVIYEAWYQRLAAVTAFAATATMVVASFRARGFEKRSTLLVELDASGSVIVSALDHGTPLEQAATAVQNLRDNTLSIDVPDGLRPPLLMLALDGEAVPAVLGTWTLAIGANVVASGQLEDSSGDVIDWSGDLSGPLRCTWQLR